MSIFRPIERLSGLSSAPRWVINQVSIRCIIGDRIEHVIETSALDCLQGVLLTGIETVRVNDQAPDHQRDAIEIFMVAIWSG